MSEKMEKTSIDRHTRAFQKHGDFFRPYLDKAVKHIEVIGLDNFEKASDGHLMVICPHRSHMDYVVGGLELSARGITRLRFAAGDNLTRIPWFGKKIREMGAFSVFRGKSSQRSYLFKLTEQVSKLLTDGNKVIVYPEGGRTYSGRMLDIKTGIAGSAVMAQHTDLTTPVYYLPMTMTYDFLPEVPYYPLLLKGKKLRDTGKSGLQRFWGSFLYYWADGWSFFKLLFNTYDDRVRIIIGDPVKITDIVDVEGLYREGARNEFLANRDAIAVCAQYISTTFLTMFPLLSQHLVAYLLDQQISVTPKEIETLLKELQEKEGNVTFIESHTPEMIIEQGSITLQRHKGLRIKKGDFRSLNHTTIAYFAGAVKDILERE